MQKIANSSVDSSPIFLMILESANYLMTERRYDTILFHYFFVLLYIFMGSVDHYNSFINYQNLKLFLILLLYEVKYQNTHTHIHTQAHTHRHTQTHTELSKILEHTHIRTNTHICTHTHAHAHTHTHTHTHTRTHIYMPHVSLKLI